MTLKRKMRRPPVPPDDYPIDEKGFKKRRPRRESGVYVTSDGIRKKRVEVLISEDLANMVYAEASKIYGSCRGAVSWFIESLLREWFIKRNPGLDNIHGRMPEQVFIKVLKRIADSRGEYVSMLEKAQVVERELRDAIMKERGADPRTVKKWINLFLQQGFIAYVGGFPPNRIFEVKKIPKTPQDILEH